MVYFTHILKIHQICDGKNQVLAVQWLCTKMYPCKDGSIHASYTPVEVWSKPLSLLSTALCLFFSPPPPPPFTCHVLIAFFFCHFEMKQMKPQAIVSLCSFTSSVSFSFCPSVGLQGLCRATCISFIVMPSAVVRYRAIQESL